MTLLDKHIHDVRAKLGLALFVETLATTLLIAATAVLLYAVLRQFAAVVFPREWILLMLCLGASAGIAAWLAARRRPDPLAAAVAIDEKLGLKERFSTALHARNRDDFFARAAVRDAETTAAGVDLRRQFPLHWPRKYWSVLAIALLAAAVLGLIRPRNLFSPEAAQNQQQAKVQDEARERAKENVERAIATIDQAPKAVGEKASLQLAKAELQDLMKKPDFDPAAANRKALAAMQDLQKALESTKQDPALAEAKRNEQQMASMQPPTSQPGPVSEAHQDLAQGKFDAAGQKLDEAVKEFDKLNSDQKAAAAQQMKQLSDQLKSATNSPQDQQRLEQQMKQLGMDPQQQQAAKDAMKQAAQGDGKVPTQLQQLAKQSVQKLNNGQPPTEQQQQQMDQALKQMQAQTNTQQQQQQLQKDADKLAEAMQQSSGQQQQGKSDQAQQSQDMQQSMADAQKQLQKMQAQSDAARQQAQTSQNADQTSASAQGQMNGQDAKPGAGQTPSQGQAGKGETGKGAPGGEPGVAAAPGGSSWGNGHGQPLGASRAPAEATKVDKAVSNSQNTDPDHVLASSLIKSDTDRGQSTAQLQSRVRNAAQQAAEEVDTERVNREGQQVVRDYFGAIGDGK